MQVIVLKKIHISLPISGNDVLITEIKPNKRGYLLWQSL